MARGDISDDHRVVEAVLPALKAAGGDGSLDLALGYLGGLNIGIRFAMAHPEEASAWATLAEARLDTARSDSDSYTIEQTLAFADSISQKCHELRIVE